MRDLVARGYVIPGGEGQRGGGQAPMFPCRTLSDLDDPGLRSVTCQVPDIGTVTFGIDHTPLHRISIQFEWAEPFGEL